MRVRLARTAGFCMGVRRAMELALQAAHDEPGDICTYGPLIHNPQVLELLEGKGVSAIKQIPRPGAKEGGTVIIRAHGVPPEEKKALRLAGFANLVDGTCPRVVKVQAIIRRAAKAGRDPVIVGDAEHAEVRGLMGHSLGRGHVVSRPEEVAGLPELGQVVAVAQTTQSEELFANVVAALRERFANVEVHDTICEATHNRQAEVLRLARESDGVVVVGGRFSGNTRRLFELAGSEGRPAFLVETEDELDQEALSGLGSVALTAGASTPNWMIRRVLRELNSIRSSKENGAGFWVRRLFRFLVRSQVLVAAGAAGMTYAASLLQGVRPSLLSVAVAFCYIFAMHILNHFLDKEAGKYNDPDRAAFLSKHRNFLIGSGVASACLAILLCTYLGPLPLLAVGLMSALGLLYSVPFLPAWLGRQLGIESLKDIPGSKTVSAALAWAVIAALLPALTHGSDGPAGTAVAFIFVLVLVFARCALFDILDEQGDLIVGKETIPIALGKKNTSRMLSGLLAGLMAMLALSALAGLAPGLAWLLILPPLGVALMQQAFHKNLLMPGAFGEGLVDLNFILAGVVALAWSWLAV